MPFWVKSAVASFLAALLMSCAVGLKVHEWRVASLRASWESEKKEAVNAVYADCAAKMKLTSEESHALQNKLRGADTRHADAIHELLKHEARKCEGSKSGATAGYDAATGGGGLLGADTQAALSLIDLGHQAERNTEKLISCQNFIRRERLP